MLDYKTEKHSSFKRLPSQNRSSQDVLLPLLHLIPLPTWSCKGFCPHGTRVIGSGAPRRNFPLRALCWKIWSCGEVSPLLHFGHCKNLYAWFHFPFLTDWHCCQEIHHCHHLCYSAADVMVSTGGQLWFLYYVTITHWSVCNLVDASSVLFLMRDFCKCPLSFCSFPHLKGNISGLL